RRPAPPYRDCRAGAWTSRPCLGPAWRCRRARAPPSTALRSSSSPRRAPPGSAAGLAPARARRGRCRRVRCALLRSDGSAPPRAPARGERGATGRHGASGAPARSPLMLVVPLIERKRDGRGLGHTGGTLDKLEAIPGFRTGLSLAEAKAQVLKLGCAMIGQTPEIAPADRRIYALRDVTGTVEAIPLIAASIMSKKLAEGLNALVLDVKRGSGAFLPGLEQSLELARTMIALGEDRGCPTVALLTAMDRPLGRACGNALETEEAILALRGEGPPDLMAVTYALGVEMLLAAGIDQTSTKARQRLENAFASGLAAEKFERVIEAQGGNPRVVEDPSLLPQANAVEVFAAPATGVVTAVEPRTIGHAIVAMGGGRLTVEDPVDPTVGYVITVKPGDRVLAGEPIASVFAKDASGIDLGFEALGKAIGIGAELTAQPLALISHRVTKDGVEELQRDTGKETRETGKGKRETKTTGETGHEKREK